MNLCIVLFNILQNFFELNLFYGDTSLAFTFYCHLCLVSNTLNGNVNEQLYFCWSNFQTKFNQNVEIVYVIAQCLVYYPRPLLLLNSFQLHLIYECASSKYLWVPFSMYYSMWYICLDWKYNQSKWALSYFQCSA